METMKRENKSESRWDTALNQYRASWQFILSNLTSLCHHSCGNAKPRQSDLEVKNPHFHQSCIILTFYPSCCTALSARQLPRQKCTQNWCSLTVVSEKAIRNQTVPPYTEWWGETNNQATTPFGYWSSMVFLPIWPHSASVRWNKIPKRS